MKKIKIAQIGMGHDHAAVVFDSLLAQPDIFEVVGFAIPEEETTYPERADEYKEKAPLKSVEEILNYPDLDAVTIECEELILTKYALMAAEKGLQIHMDKPGGVDLPLFEKLIATVKEKQLVFHLGYMYRYNPFVVEAMEKVKNGTLGEIYSVEAHMDCPHPAEKRQWLDRFPGGMMFYLGCHLVDLIIQIQGMPEEIIPYNTSTKDEGVTADDFGMAVFRYKNGISFAKTCAHEPGGYFRRQLVICGTEGTIEIKPLEYIKEDTTPGMMLTDMRETHGSDWHRFGPIKTTEEFNRYDTMMATFAKMVVGEKENPWSYDYELELYKQILKACGVE